MTARGRNCFNRITPVLWALHWLPFFFPGIVQSSGYGLQMPAGTGTGYFWNIQSVLRRFLLLLLLLFTLHDQIRMTCLISLPLKKLQYESEEEASLFNGCYSVIEWLEPCGSTSCLYKTMATIILHYIFGI